MRIPPLPAAEWDDAVLTALRMMPEELRNPTAAGNAVGTLVNHPDLTRPFLNFSFYLLTRSTLDPGSVRWPFCGLPTAPRVRTSGTSTWRSEPMLG